MMKKKKNYDYFAYFCDVAEIICESADYLNDSLVNFDKSTFGTRTDDMHKIENKADTLKREMSEHLLHEFITPVEREDIVELAHQLDDVIDAMDHVMRRLYMFDVDEISPAAKEFSALIIDCSKSLKATIEEFKNFKNSKSISEKIQEINSYEYAGDQLLSKCMHDMFCTVTDARALLIWTTIYENLENCLNSCEDAVKTIESIIMKNT